MDSTAKTSISVLANRPTVQSDGVQGKGLQSTGLPRLVLKLKPNANNSLLVLLLGVNLSTKSTSHIGFCVESI